MNRRGSGVLLHITSLPSRFGIGDFGPEAYDFADRLAGAGQRYWQILPLNPTDGLYDHAPYHSISAFAFNPLLISPEFLVSDGLIDEHDLENPGPFPSNRVDFDQVKAFKEPLFEKAFRRFQKRNDRGEFERFVSRNTRWLNTYALFRGLKDKFGPGAWNEWPEDIRRGDAGAIDRLRGDIAETKEKALFLQFIAARQWMALKNHCNERGVFIIGDIPIYVDYDSADLWAHQDNYKLDGDGRPTVVAGVPPDYFSETGQLWGNPIYDWDVMRRTGFEWWMRRVGHNLDLFDIVRIDHFRGLVAYWEIPAGEKTAMNGSWVEVPVYDLFDRLSLLRPFMPIIAEDLGLITPDVREVIRQYDLPGMKVIQFAFGEDMRTNPYIPHNVEENYIYYIGTHDNNTARGWYENETSREERSRVDRYLGREVTADTVHIELMHAVMMSRARTVIFQVQDLIGAGGDARMNVPSKNTNNWRWRCPAGALKEEHMGMLADLTRMYGRT